MADFPLLKTGAVAQYPSSVRVETSTRVLRFVDGGELRYRESSTPEKAWTLRLDRVTEEELSAIEEFFVSQNGQFGRFRFTDPWDGVVYPDCSFESDTLRSQIFGEEWAGATLVVRSNKPQ